MPSNTKLLATQLAQLGMGEKGVQELHEHAEVMRLNAQMLTKETLGKERESVGMIEKQGKLFLAPKPAGEEDGADMHGFRQSTQEDTRKRENDNLTSSPDVHPTTGSIINIET